MKVVSFQILFVLRVLCLVTLAGGQPKAPIKCSKVCNRFTRILPEKRIKSYRETEPQCAKQAIIFITLASLEICADPKNEQVQKIMRKLDQKKASAAPPVPHAATSASVPEKPGIFHKHIGLTVTAPSQATAATTLFQGTGTTVLERTHAPAAMTEVTSKYPPAMQSTTQFSAGSSPAIWEIATRSEVSSEANRDSLKPAHSTTSAAGMVSSQPILHPTALVHGFDNTVGLTEEPVGYAASATADVQDTSSPTSNSDPVSVTKGLDHPVLSTDESLDPTSARANTSDTASRSFNSDLPSILNSMEISSAPATPVPPETTSISTLNPTTAIAKGPPAHTNNIFSSSADAVGTRTFGYSSPLGKQDHPGTLVFTTQPFSGQARAQLTTKRPHDSPSFSFLPRSQTHFIIPVSLVGGLIACTVAAVWLYTKFGVRTETVSREMVQGLLYQKEGHQNNVYPMEII